MLTLFNGPRLNVKGLVISILCLLGAIALVASLPACRSAKRVKTEARVDSSAASSSYDYFKARLDSAVNAGSSWAVKKTGKGDYESEAIVEEFTLEDSAARAIGVKSYRRSTTKQRGASATESTEQGTAQATTQVAKETEGAQAAAQATQVAKSAKGTEVVKPAGHTLGGWLGTLGLFTALAFLVAGCMAKVMGFSPLAPVLFIVNLFKRRK